jgi:hypothetical protein
MEKFCKAQHLDLCDALAAMQDSGTANALAIALLQMKT